MPDKRFRFPDGFLWGAATSAHQVEGGNRNDWTEWERSNAKRLGEIAKRRDWQAHILDRYPNPLQEENYISGRACDHYHRFREDFDIAKQLGHNAHRFSIEWSRIEPEEGKFNQAEIEHYREVIKALRERGIEPFVTLWHWTLPLWIRDRGGWESEETVHRFSAFCERMGGEFRNDVRNWMVLNEPGYWLLHAYITKKFPAPRKRPGAALIAYRNLIWAHKETYAKLKAIDRRFQIGVVESTGWISPEPLRWLLHDVRNYTFPWLVRGHFDFFGLNYYRRTPLLGETRRQVSDIGWEVYPQGLYRMVRGAYKRFRKPIVITENGIADTTDAKRAAYIRSHLHALEKAINKGIDVCGYFYWSLLDDFEWDSGFGPRFGLVEVDYKTLERKIRPSAWEYKKIIESNSLDLS